MRLDIQKTGLLSSDVWLVRDRQRWVRLSLGAVRERVDFVVEDRPCSVRKSDADGVLVLSDASTGLPLAQRVKLGVFSSDCDVEAMMPDGTVHQIRLDRVSGMEKRVELRVGGLVVGEVRRSGLWKPQTWAEVPDSWPVPVAVFVIWLALRQFASEDA
ncbi:MAG: hypothetical protein IAE99_02980, partial [Rhodothermales bacterium]|nr:hypothetical protein [Rhodothermales bacterium]